MVNKKQEVQEKEVIVDGNETYEEAVAVGWTPEAGDMIKGAYVDVKHDVGRLKATIYILETENGQMGVFANKVLQGKMNGIAIGEKIIIKYLGKQPTNDGSAEYKNFKVFRLK